MAKKKLTRRQLTVDPRSLAAEHTTKKKARQGDATATAALTPRQTPAPLTFVAVDRNKKGKANKKDLALAKKQLAKVEYRSRKHGQTLLRNEAFLGNKPDKPSEWNPLSKLRYQKETQAYARGKNVAEMLHLDQDKIPVTLSSLKNHDIRESLIKTHEGLIEKQNKKIKEAQKRGNKIDLVEATAMRDKSKKNLNELKQRRYQGHIIVAKKNQKKLLKQFEGHPNAVKQVKKNYKQFRRKNLTALGQLQQVNEKVTKHLDKNIDKLSRYEKGYEQQNKRVDSPQALKENVPGTRTRVKGEKVRTVDPKTLTNEERIKLLTTPSTVRGGKYFIEKDKNGNPVIKEVIDHGTVQYQLPGQDKWRDVRYRPNYDPTTKAVSKWVYDTAWEYNHPKHPWDDPKDTALNLAMIVPELRGLTALGRGAKVVAKAIKPVERAAKLAEGSRLGKGLDTFRINRALKIENKGLKKLGDDYIRKANDKELFEAKPFKEKLKETTKQSVVTASKPEQYVINVGKAGGKLIRQGPAQVGRNGLRAAKDFRTAAGEISRKQTIVAAGVTGAALGMGGKVAYDHPDFSKRVVKDTHDLVTGSVTSIGLLGRAVYNASHGDTKELKQMWTGYKQTDPVALLIRGVIEGNPKLYNRAWEMTKERPVSSLLSFGGAYSIAGRALGTGTRFASSGRYGSIAGEPEQLFGRTNDFYHGVYVEKDYSPNLITKQMQKAYRGTYGSGPLSNGKGLAHTVPGYSKLRWQKALNRDIDLRDAATRNNKTILAEETAHQYGGVGKEMEKRIKKIIGPKSTVSRAGQSDVAFFIGTRLLRNKETALEDAANEINHLKQQRQKVMRAEVPAIDANIKTLENLMKHPEILKDDQIWAHVEALKDLEDTHQARLVQTGQLSPEQAEMARWIPYAKRHMGAVVEKGKLFIPKKNKEEALTLFDSSAYEKNPQNFQRLEMSDILNHASKAGVTEPMFIGLRSSPKETLSRKLGIEEVPSLDTRSFDSFPAFADFTRTGKSIENGTYDGNFDAITQQGMLSRNMLEEIAKFDEIMHTYGYRQKNGKLYKEVDAIKAAEMLEKKHNADMTVMNYQAFKNRLKLLSDDTKNHDVKLEDLDKDELKKEAGLPVEKQSESYVVIPQSVAARLNKHLSINASNTPMNQLVQEFKGAVLPFSLKWQFGNISDMTIRSAFEGVNPLGISGIRQRKLFKTLKEMDAKNGTDFYLQTIARNGSGYMNEAAHRLFEGASDRMSTNRMYSNWLYRDLIKQNPTTMGVLTYRLAQQASFLAARKAEAAFRNAAFSKAGMKHVRAQRGGFLKAVRMTPDVIEELAQGLTDTALQNKLTRQVNDVMGDYTKLSPRERSVVKNWIPFYLWLRASTKFVATLPVKYPVKAGLLASLNRLTEKEREEFGLSDFGNAIYKKGDKIPGGKKVGDVIETVPGFLKGSIPTDDGLLMTSNYTSFGPLYDLSQMANFAIPQINFLINSASGVDFKYDKLVDQQGKEISNPAKLGVAIQQGLTTYIPLLGYAEQFHAGGRLDEASTPFHRERDYTATPYKVYQDPKETKKETATRIFWPFRPISSDQKDDIELGPNLDNVTPTKKKSSIFKDSKSSKSGSIFKDSGKTAGSSIFK